MIAASGKSWYIAERCAAFASILSKLQNPYKPRLITNFQHAESDDFSCHLALKAIV